jgi:hypothetical protein
MFCIHCLNTRGKHLNRFTKTFLVIHGILVPFAQDRVGLQEISVLKVISFGLAACDLLYRSGVNFGLDIIPIVVFKTGLNVFIGLRQVR